MGLIPEGIVTYGLCRGIGRREGGIDLRRPEIGGLGGPPDPPVVVALLLAAPRAASLSAKLPPEAPGEPLLTPSPSPPRWFSTP